MQSCPNFVESAFDVEIFVVPTASATGSVAAGILAAVIRSKPDAVLGLATGGSPLPIYAALAGHTVDMSAVRGFALDEYVGLPAGHPESYAEVIRREVTERLHLDPANVAVPDGSHVHRVACERSVDRQRRAARGQAQDGVRLGADDGGKDPGSNRTGG